MDELSANTIMRNDIKAAIENGLPTYAECGGLMYLTRSLDWHGKKADMVGAIPADTVMHEAPQGRGYIRLKETSEHLWPAILPQTKEIIAGHEFHYSALENLDPSMRFAYRIVRGTGIDGNNDGIVYKNLLACLCPPKRYGKATIGHNVS